MDREGKGAAAAAAAAANKPAKCCGKTFVDRVEFIQHIKVAHGKAPMQKCYICKDVFFSSTRLWSHIHEGHGTQQGYTAASQAQKFRGQKPVAGSSCAAGAWTAAGAAGDLPPPNKQLIVSVTPTTTTKMINSSPPRTTTTTNASSASSTSGGVFMSGSRPTITVKNTVPGFNRISNPSTHLDKFYASVAARYQPKASNTCPRTWSPLKDPYAALAKPSVLVNSATKSALVNSAPNDDDDYHHHEHKIYDLVLPRPAWLSGAWFPWPAIVCRDAETGEFRREVTEGTCGIATELHVQFLGGSRLRCWVYGDGDRGAIGSFVPNRSAAMASRERKRAATDGDEFEEELDLAYTEAREAYHWSRLRRQSLVVRHGAGGGATNKGSADQAEATARKMHVANVRCGLDDAKFSDVEIACGDAVFRAHKFALAAQSDVFRAMFQDEMLESKLNRVEVDDVEPSVFKSLLHYIYTGHQDPKTWPDMAPELFSAADKYNIAALKDLCEVYILEQLSKEIVPDKALHMLVLAHLHSSAPIKAAAIAYIGKNKMKVEKTYAWQRLEEEQSKLAYEVTKKLAGMGKYP